ncbi:putative radical SAM superfamily Fe-S cluster-containing enzyme [Caulobacter ginsengisoli]|uniref:Radical SAM superfamily Fe-S cluster-containing enzyme n=1 Tax=Caulobacter ginsengisoli TaxID=400775 RepID=A0ABU0IQ14_9CAUL|nr:radical SAM protein [Caulobacter ginsengisoli]MDQ0464097.1 putative radical SAM superfamily Fe-S cluster-containing enzyme [Caulobacter ginsengisoli]
MDLPSGSETAATKSEAPARKVAPYLFFGQTTSLCETCLALVPTKIITEGQDVYFLKRCREHGVQKTLVSDDLDYWKATKDWLKPGDRPLSPQTRTDHGCPYDCGLCPDHEQHSCLAIIEVNEACNLTCPVCFADSSVKRTGHRPLAEIEAMLDALVASEGEPDLVQLSGGEPTLHPQFFEILDAAKARPIRHLMINTNGLRIAREPGFAARLAAYAPGFEVYLQFDSLRPEALMDIRGADLSKVRVQALEALEAANLSTTLVVTVKAGVNDQDIPDIVRFALQWRCVRGVTFQPIQDAGRNEGFDPSRHRALLSQIRRRIAEAGVFGLEDLIPLPCNPDQICIGYGLRNGDQVSPITALFPRELFVAAAPNTVTFEGYPELQQRVFELMSLSTAQADTSDKLANLLCCLPEAAVPQSLAYEHTFRVVISQFLDRFNFDLGTVKRSCVHFVETDGRIIPFDTYNTFYRPGAPGAAALKRGQHR